MENLKFLERVLSFKFTITAMAMGLASCLKADSRIADGTFEVVMVTAIAGFLVEEVLQKRLPTSGVGTGGTGTEPQ
jgi:hypothetical protein